MHQWTDIVERLRTYTDPDCLERKAADEIERLEARYDEAIAEQERQYYEIERLRRRADDAEENLLGCHNEVERLRADKDVRRSQERNTSYEQSIYELEQEIERLRAEIECLTNNKWSEIELALGKVRAHEMWKYLHGSADDLLADNERLRAALQDIKDRHYFRCACGDIARRALEDK